MYYQTQREQVKPVAKARVGLVKLPFPFVHSEWNIT